jgi:hypothetical protein
MNGHDPERALSRALKARTAARRPPAFPEAARGIARSEAPAVAPSLARAGARAGARASARASVADLGWTAALAACLACSLILGRAEGDLARRLDDPSISRAIREAVSESNLAALELRLGAGRE